MKKRILCFVFVLLFMFSAFPLVGSAADVQLVSEDIDKTDVMADLKKMGYDTSSYKKNVTADYVRLIHFQEWGYRYDGNTSEHALYLYVFNPSGKAIQEDSYKNAVQLQGKRGDGTGTGVKKFHMDLISISRDQGVENVFLKFKVRVGADFIRALEQGMRRYELSGIELHREGSTNATDYKIGNVYGCSGYMPYRGANNSPTSTLTTSVTDLLTIDLDLHGTSWHTLTSNKGAGYRYEVFSVYYAIPNDIIEKYGDKNDFTKGLSKVEGTFEEYKVNGLLTSNSEVESGLYPWLGEKTAIYYESIPYWFLVHPDNFDTRYYNYEATGKSPDSDYDIRFLTSVFSVANKDNFEGASYDETEKAFEALWDQKGHPLYLPYVDEGATAGKQTYTVEAGKDLADKIGTYASLGRGWWSNFLNGNTGLQLEGEYYENIQSIRPVTSADVSKVYQDSYIASTLFIDEGEVADLQEYVEAANKADRTVFLMRFAVRDFFMNDVQLYENDGWLVGAWDLVGGDHYYFEKTIFRNFDVLSTTWKDQYNQSRTIPVVCAPIEVLGTIAPPQEGSNWDALKNFFQGIIPGGAGNGWGDDDESFAWWKKLKEVFDKYADWVLWIGAILLLALFAWLWKFIGPILKPLFGATGSIFSGISERQAKRRKEREERNRAREEESRKQSEESRKAEKHSWDREDRQERKDKEFSKNFTVRTESSSPSASANKRLSLREGRITLKEQENLLASGSKKQRRKK